jgi:UDP-N-acetylglucosamine 1-carboxyvinyltransferase
MDKFVINGGRKLSGNVKISGAKNAALALIPATLLNSSKNVLTNVPEVNDIYTMIKMLKSLGSVIEFNNHELLVNNQTIHSQFAPYELVKKMRASIYVLGPLLSKYGYAKVSMPGGCAWGPRPVNLHIDAMKKLGAEIDFDGGYIIAKANKLVGNKIHFDVSSVGATGNALMAAVLAKGETVISNAAMEPEITSLANFLVKMGAVIEGIGGSVLTIQGVDDLHGADSEIIGDRIEAGTLLIAGAITKSNISITYPDYQFIESITSKLEEVGCKILINNDLIELFSENIEIKSEDVATAIYPGFPTDMQAQWIALMSIANGVSKVTDNIYFDRFAHVPELNRLGANIEVIHNSAIVKGVNSLKGAKVMSTDLRASASLVLAGLIAEGTTEVLRIYHLDRGYEKIESKLSQLGADIVREKTPEF